jgi:hypothetical protein
MSARARGRFVVIHPFSRRLSVLLLSLLFGLLLGLLLRTLDRLSGKLLATGGILDKKTRGAVRLLSPRIVSLSTGMVSESQTNRIMVAV